MIKIKRKHYKVNLENPIKNKKDDIFGYDYEVKRIKNAIDEDANVIGIVSEYGSGKSSLIELLIRRLCILKYKIIKVNLWDNKLGIAEVFDIPEKKKELPAEDINNSKTVLPPKDSTIRLHKTFLTQISSQIKKYNITYVNRRINANYGAAKISFPSYRSLIKWFAIYLSILIGILYLICTFVLDISSYSSISLDDKKKFISFIIPKIPLLLLGFVFFYIIFNKEVLFSFWNNSKSREITEEDTIQIYNELFGKNFKYIPRLRKVVIIIEDLDRIENSGLVEFYLNEFYRLYIEGNANNRKGITMIFCLKDNKKDSSNSKYVKIFDYISYINQINIDDKEEILKQLVLRDQLLHDLSIDKDDKVDISKYSWLIEGKKINIRTIKRRIEHFKNIYLMIYSRGISKKNKTKDLAVDLTTCAFAAYLKTEFNSELDEILSDYDENGLNFIDRTINRKIIGEPVNSENIENTDKDSENLKIVKNLFIDMINNGYIDSQYKKYFYNFPKGTKIYTTTEKFAADFITYNNEIKSENIANVIKTFSEVANDFIKDRINYVVSLGKEMPNVVLYEAKSFSAAIKISKVKLKNKYRNEFALNDKNVEKICSRLNILKNSNIDKKILSEFISDIIDENAISNDLDTIIISKFRIALIDCFEEFVLNFKNLYNQIQISEEEIKRINNLDTLLSIVSLIEHNDDIDKLISNQFNTIESNNKKNILLKLIDVIPNYNFIYYIDVKKMLDSDKNEIYLQICKKNISDNEKLELLLYLDYNNSNIADELISGKNINEEKLISYLNRQNTCSELCKSYINNSNKVFTISDVIYNSLDKNSEKYHAYYMLKHHKISDTCDAKMLSEIFLNYSCPEILDCYKNNSIIGILKKQGVYRKFSSNNVSKEKMLLLTIVPQTKDMVSSIISNDSISQDNKRAYIENINEISKDASIYITSLIKKSTPIALLKAVDKNRGKIYSSFDKTYKTRVKKDLNKIIPKEDPVQSSD